MERSSDKIYTDVAVIGGGVIGSSASYYLSKKNLDVTIIERSGIGSGASGACDGFIFVQSKKDMDLICLTLKSLGIFKNLSDELSYDLEFKNCGGLVIYTGDYKKEEATIISPGDKFRSYIDDDSNSDFIEFVDGEKIREMEPFISEEVSFGTFCRYESQVNPLSLNIAYAIAAKNSGAEIVLNEGVRSFEIEDTGKISFLETCSGLKVFAGEFLICTGAWSRQIGEAIGINIPVLPRRGTILVTEVIPDLINHVIIDYDYICCKFDLNRELGFTVEQTAPGNLLIGSTREFKDFDDGIDPYKISLLVKRATELFPKLCSVDIIRMFNGFRPYSSDSRPFIGLIPGFSNLWIATGHEGDGVALSPATGKLISELIEKKSEVFKDFKKEAGIYPDLFYCNLYDKIEGFEGINTRKFSPENRLGPDS